MHPLDDPIRHSLEGVHARFAERRGRVIRYSPEVATFMAFPADPGPTDWADAAKLAGPGGTVSLTDTDATPPADWNVLTGVGGVQLLGENVETAPDPEAVMLTADDVPEVLALVEATRPGPFRLRTIELGTYLGIRRQGRLVALAGERLHPPGYTEISAVCTDVDHRGQGLATRLVRAVAHGIRQRGEIPFLHAAATNSSAIRLYESLGFTLRRRREFRSAVVPPADR